MVCVSYESDWGGLRTLALFRDEYAGGGLAVGAVDVTEPPEDGVGFQPWGMLTVNLPRDPLAAEWCAGAGRVVVDSNDSPAAVVRALGDAGVVTYEGEWARSGFCSSPLATVSPWALEAMGSLAEVVAESEGSA